MFLMKLEVEHGSLLITVGTVPGRHGFTKDAVRAILEAYSRGGGEGLRHFAEHGTLPPEPPTWDGATVKADSYGWNFYNADGDLLASVAKKSSGWFCDLVVSSESFSGETPQSAVNEARAWMRKRWCL